MIREKSDIDEKMGKVAKGKKKKKEREIEVFLQIFKILCGYNLKSK